MLLFWNRYGKAVLCAAVTLALAALVAALSRPGVLPAGSWGLSFPTPGETPVGNATAETLREYDAAFVGDPAEKTVYLTFDCGYENGYTGAILDTLAKHRVPAAFFVVGSYLDAAPDLVRRMADEGHIVGNHTEHHYDMSRIGDEAVFREELASVERKYRSVTGREMEKFYRPPRGIYSEENLRMAKDLGYRTVFWSLAYVDWYRDKQPSADEAFSKLIPRIHNGAVVLLHATSETNAAILDELLTKWENMGYRFAPVSDLF